MLLMTWDKARGNVYLAQQMPDFRFNRLDREAGSHLYGKNWLHLDRYKTGAGEWTQISPLSMVKWDE